MVKVSQWEGGALVTGTIRLLIPDLLQKQCKFNHYPLRGRDCGIASKSRMTSAQGLLNIGGYALHCTKAKFPPKVHILGCKSEPPEFQTNSVIQTAP